MSTILIVAAPFDAPTSYGYHWLKRYATYAAKRGHRIIFLRTANLETFRQALIKYNPKFVILNGHGGRKGVEVDNNIILGVVDFDPELGVKIRRQNPSWMSGRLVYLATCNTGKQLAYRLVDCGAVAVAAYKDAFIFLSGESVAVQNDRLAKPFFISMLQLPLHLANGETWSQATNATRKAFNYYLETAETRNNTEMAKYLNHDLVNFVSLGDGSATL